MKPSITGFTPFRSEKKIFYPERPVAPATTLAAG
jgi:hypothetical protein